MGSMYVLSSVVTATALAMIASAARYRHRLARVLIPLRVEQPRSHRRLS